MFLLLPSVSDRDNEKQVVAVIFVSTQCELFKLVAHRFLSNHDN